MDVETGIVYHHALRIAEDRYQLNNKPGEVSYGIRLVAERVKMK